MAEKGKMPSIALVFGGHGGSGKMAERGEPEDTAGNEEGKAAAGEDMLAAIEAKDAKALASAVANLFAICESEPHEEYGEEED